MSAIRLVLLVISCVQYVSSGCRYQERNSCESLCHFDQGELVCELRIAVILPNLPSIEASLMRVLPVLELAEEQIRRDKLLPDFHSINWIPFDDQCKQELATLAIIDAYAQKCSHLIIGSSCDYSLASMSRISKYLYNDGLNIITAGGLSWDFEESKTSCEDEYHMLHRVGTMSYKQLSSFMMKIMEHFEWKRAVFVYDKDSYYQVGGQQSGFLMMNTLAKFFKESDIDFSAFTIASNVTSSSSHLLEDLMNKGRESGSEWRFF